MNNKVKATLRYALEIESLFIFVCLFLVALEYFIGEGNFTIKGTIYCLVVLQVPVVFLVLKHWILLRKDPYI